MVLILPMSSTFSNAQNVPRPGISSNFDRRIHVVGGCREVRISPDDNRNGRARHWMSSSIQVLAKIFFYNANHFHGFHLNPARDYLNLQSGHFLGVA
jgi:hypothetical protein